MRISLTLAFCLLVLQSFAQPLSKKIEAAYADFVDDTQLKYATSSLTVLNAITGDIIFSRNENTGLAPASTLKTVTSATAYYLLGQDFTWETTLGYSGQVDVNGTLNGDLILTGGGDPTLGSSRFEQTKPNVILNKWIDAIYKAGIKKINGSVIADDRLFGTQTIPIGWIWQDIGNYYGAGPNALTWKENQFDLSFKPGAKVAEATNLINVENTSIQLKIVNEVTTGKVGSGDNVYVYSAPYSDVIYLRGTYGIDLKKIVKASNPDPSLSLAATLQDTLKKLGIQINTTATTARILAISNNKFLLPSTIISVHKSPKLDQVIYWFNQKSINLYGEHIVKTLGMKCGKEASTEEGMKVIKDFWKNKLQIDPNSMNIVDGSGLSPSTRITTLSVARILQSLKKEPWIAAYYESLPLINNTKMKSGSIADVLAYAGYQTNSTGDPLAFSFIVNNYNGSTSSIKSKMFSVLDMLK